MAKKICTWKGTWKIIIWLGRQGGKELKNILNYTQKFNANITSSNAYFCKRRKELEALMQQEGLCTTWFMFLAADNH